MIIRTTTDGDFWSEIYHRLRGDPDSIKLMIKNKAMTIHDMDSDGMTILMFAACFGCYELVQFCMYILIFPVHYL